MSAGGVEGKVTAGREGGVITPRLYTAQDTDPARRSDRERRSAFETLKGTTAAITRYYVLPGYCNGIHIYNP